MKNQLSTSIEQSRHLLSCGVDPKTADMYYTNYSNKYNEKMPYIGEIGIRKDLIPAWSPSRMIALLPNRIKEDDDPYDEINEYGLFIYPYLQGWQMEYQYCADEECHSLICTYDTSLIEACVQMIEWLLSNGYSLNKIEE